MRFAYADPPYPGCSHLYSADDGPYHAEVNHGLLIQWLCDDFDGWALSTASTTLGYVLTLCPPDVRIAAWTKPFAVFRPNVNPGYTWEPVLFYGSRKRDRYEPTVRDHLAQPITLRRGLVGAKPEAFCRWVLDLLGYRRGVDELVDVFPGTGVMGRIAGTAEPVQEGLFADVSEVAR